MPTVYLDRLWVFFGPAPIRLSTIVTLIVVLAFVAWRFRSEGLRAALYNGVVAALFAVFLYDALFNLAGEFPPTDMLPPSGVALMVGSIVLGLLQAYRHFVSRRLSVTLFSALMLDWAVWQLTGFPFNLPSTQPLNLVEEAFNVTTKLLLSLGYAIGLAVRRMPVVAGASDATGRAMPAAFLPR